MKTNYKIGETYYWKNEHLILRRFEDDEDCSYPLRCFNIANNEYSFTLDGRYRHNENPSLSTSPTEFIAPKEEKVVDTQIDKAILALKWLKEISNCSKHDMRSEYDNMIKVEQAISFLKSEGYTITKQY
tara:strand:- start:11136 stop:11522 length:387 start_codon:yes stop_codon:yes gene_type:complete